MPRHAAANTDDVTEAMWSCRCLRTIDAFAFFFIHDSLYIVSRLTLPASIGRAFNRSVADGFDEEDEEEEEEEEEDKW
jgi:hypothetical protein